MELRIKGIGWFKKVKSYCPALLQYNTNMELRMKYADQPDKFLESEVDLDEAVKNMMVRQLLTLFFLFQDYHQLSL